MEVCTTQGIIYSVYQVHTPIISSHVSPLKDALPTGQILRQLVMHLEDLTAGARIVLVVLGHDVDQQMLVEAGLGGGFLPVVIGAHPELEVAHVIGGQLHADLDDLVLGVLPCDDALSVHSAGFVRPWLNNRKRSYDSLTISSLMTRIHTFIHTFILDS